MAHLLYNLNYSILHHFLVSSHCFKFGVQLVDGRTQSIIGFSLSGDELLHKTLQIRVGMRRLLLMGWIIWSLVLKT